MKYAASYLPAARRPGEQTDNPPGLPAPILLRRKKQENAVKINSRVLAALHFKFSLQPLAFLCRCLSKQATDFATGLVEEFCGKMKFVTDFAGKTKITWMKNLNPPGPNIGYETICVVGFGVPASAGVAPDEGTAESHRESIGCISLFRTWTKP